MQCNVGSEAQKSTPSTSPNAQGSCSARERWFAMVSLTDQSPCGRGVPSLRCRCRKRYGRQDYHCQRKQERVRGGGTYLTSVGRSPTQRFSQRIIIAVVLSSEGKPSRARGGLVAPPKSKIELPTHPSIHPASYHGTLRQRPTRQRTSSSHELAQRHSDTCNSDNDNRSSTVRK